MEVIGQHHDHIDSDRMFSPDSPEGIPEQLGPCGIIEE
jgi:hypothetical protein